MLYILYKSLNRSAYRMICLSPHKLFIVVFAISFIFERQKARYCRLQTNSSRPSLLDMTSLVTFQKEIFDYTTAPGRVLQLRFYSRNLDNGGLLSWHNGQRLLLPGQLFNQDLGAENKAFWFSLHEQPWFVWSLILISSRYAFLAPVGVH